MSPLLRPPGPGDERGLPPHLAATARPRLVPAGRARVAEQAGQAADRAALRHHLSQSPRHSANDAAAPGRIHIVGAGLAGLAAALSLAEILPAGRVILYEASSHAGGRCRSFHDAMLDCTIDNGNHL